MNRLATTGDNKIETVAVYKFALGVLLQTLAIATGAVLAVRVVSDKLARW